MRIVQGVFSFITKGLKLVLLPSFFPFLFIDTSITSHYCAQSNQNSINDHNSIIPKCGVTSQYVKTFIFR